MYKSPIDVFVKEMRMKQEEQVLEAIQEIGVSVDKDELIKALQYDRGQYEKGFAEGRAEAIKEFAEKLKDKYSQADILCPRRIISITEKGLDDFVKEMVGKQE